LQEEACNIIVYQCEKFKVERVPGQQGLNYTVDLNLCSWIEAQHIYLKHCNENIYDYIQCCECDTLILKENCVADKADDYSQIICGSCIKLKHGDFGYEFAKCMSWRQKKSKFEGK